MLVSDSSQSLRTLVASSAQAKESKTAITFWEALSGIWRSPQLLLVVLTTGPAAGRLAQRWSQDDQRPARSRIALLGPRREISQFARRSGSARCAPCSRPGIQHHIPPP